VNVYAAIWTVTAAVGAVLSLYLAIETMRDLRALGPLANGRRVLASGRLATESIRFVVHSSFCFIGLAALGAPTGPLSVTILILVAGNVGLIANSFISLYVRRRMEREPDPATAEAVAAEVVIRAEETAEALVELASETAGELERAAAELHATSAERTAIAAERIADNTDPDRGAS
jgi:hypothetical protein